MTTLSLKDAGYLARTPLFQNLTLTFGPGDRVGLVALNGAGKTTFLRCLTGELEFSNGESTLSRGAQIGYMPQEVDEDLMSLSCRDAVLTGLPQPAREDESWRAEVVLDSLSIPKEMHDLPVSALSGGWQRIMLLARVWVADPDVLLIDEPTNHLDLEKIILLEDWLTTWAAKMPVLIASHDRSFLDAVTNKTLFLRPDVSHLFSLPYSRAKDELAHIDLEKAEERKRQLSEAGQLRRQSDKLKNIGINSGSDLLLKKQKQLRQRAEKIEESAENLHQEHAGEIRLADGATHAKALVRLEEVTIATPDDRVLFKIDKLVIAQGDRIVILGRNGTGKSTLMRMLRSALVDGHTPSGIKITPTLVTGYLDQALSDVPLERTSFDHISGRGESDAHCRSALANAGIPFDWQSRRINQLSWGQRARVALLALRLDKPNFYLLDEPTNHVDIAGQDALSEEISQRGAGCVLVSHDRTFVRDVGTRFFTIEGKKLIESETPDTYFENQRPPPD